MTELTPASARPEINRVFRPGSDSEDELPSEIGTGLEL